MADSTTTPTTAEEAHAEFETAIGVARQALAEYQADPTGSNFRIWRDASEVAIKWHRACRLAGAEGESFDNELAKLLDGKG